MIDKKVTGYKNIPIGGMGRGHMDKILHKLQMFCFEKGAYTKHFSNWDKIGNFIQDIRTWMKGAR